METVKSSPEVSIIVPCRNEQKHIEACIRSILAQELPVAFEIIIVDGLSNDGTRETLRRLSEQNPGLHIIDNPGKIAASARNIGIRHARGAYIAIMDAHTEYASDYLRTCLALLDEHPEACCSGGPIVSRGIRSFGRAAAAAMSHPVGIGNAKHRMPDHEGYAEGACFPVFRREVFDEVGLFDETLVRTEDDEFNYRVVRNGGQIYISPRARCVYYVRDTPSELFWQYCQYGYWRVAVLRKHKLPASVRHIVPLLFFLVMTVLFAAGLLLPGWWRMTAFIMPALYISVLGGAGLHVAIKHGALVGLQFPLAAFILHLSYAFGFALALAGYAPVRMHSLTRGPATKAAC
jgi:GT2 family glycosyltransferase